MPIQYSDLPAMIRILGVAISAGCSAQEEGEGDETPPPPTADDDIGASRDASRTDAEAVQRCVGVYVCVGVRVSV